jgi:hypothetical protein
VRPGWSWSLGPPAKGGGPGTNRRPPDAEAVILATFEPFVDELDAFSSEIIERPEQACKRCCFGSALTMFQAPQKYKKETQNHPV